MGPQPLLIGKRIGPSKTKCAVSAEKPRAKRGKNAPRFWLMPGFLVAATEIACCRRTPNPNGPRGYTIPASKRPAIPYGEKCGLFVTMPVPVFIAFSLAQPAAGMCPGGQIHSCLPRKKDRQECLSSWRRIDQRVLLRHPRKRKGVTCPPLFDQGAWRRRLSSWLRARRKNRTREPSSSSLYSRR
jgi:hypothetical protein